MKSVLERSAVIIFCSIIMGLFASCTSGDDNPVSNVEPEPNNSEKEVYAKKLVGVHFDFTNFFFDDEVLNIWEMKEDGTFMVYSLYEEDGEEVMDELAGTWEPFVGASSEEWGGDPSEKLNGFKAIFDFGDETIAPEERTMVYYAEEDIIDGEPYMLLINEIVLDYMYLMELAPDEEAGTRGLSDIWDGIKSFVTHPLEWVINTIGLDLGKNLTPDQCWHFYQQVQKALEKIQNQFKEKTNYKQWMSEIYTAKGKNPRICEMNIPGTHDSATGNVVQSMLSIIDSYTRTQTLDFVEQWDAGIRCFDLRLGNLKGFISLDKYYDEDMLGFFHGPIGLGEAEEGLRDIIGQLKDHPGETAIVMLDFEGSADMTCRKLAFDLIEKLKKEGSIAENLRPDMTLKDVAGRLIVFQGWDFNDVTNHIYRVGPIFNSGYNTFVTGEIAYWDGAVGARTPFFYQNLCETSMETLVTDFWKQKKDLMTQCFQATQKTKGDNSNSWAMNQASAFVGGKIHMSYSKNANVMNPWTLKYVLDHKSDKMNIITMDFAGTNEKFDGYITNGQALPHVIVESNRFQ